MNIPHRKRRRAINEPGHAHFLTCSCWQQWPLLNGDRSRRWVLEAMQRLRTRLRVTIWAYVIMPEHVHILLRPQDREYEMRRILAALKAPVARRAKAHLQATHNREWLIRLTTSHGKRQVFRSWQPGGGYDQNLWSERPIQEVSDYIHANPVRRGLVDRPTDWIWSSARSHAGLPGSLLDVDKVVLD
ncbi:Transposase IS200 like protein [Maioricimonas rarisocia]|uniref:Transposase IS200 like protein n=1 Tax=Maioricimonas rarisocia TaxID=2528026 RepID=A0A517ZDK2_9PLAN|nr:Transposase IS200 like protein [Maioricimonas rarisocia]